MLEMFSFYPTTPANCIMVQEEVCIYQWYDFVLRSGEDKKGEINILNGIQHVILDKLSHFW